jgi:hypothetical protein
LNREHLRPIKVVHIVDCEHQAAVIEVYELVIVDEQVLMAEVRVTHRLRVGVQEGARLHVQVGARVKGAIP